MIVIVRVVTDAVNVIREISRSHGGRAAPEVSGVPACRATPAVVIRVGAVAPTVRAASAATVVAGSRARRCPMTSTRRISIRKFDVTS
ncbi:hypothetical protein FOV72_15320 [Gordonia rubripertincta]|nr:hypothetical protein FOV72_15320 [Gordonia rubripertincta]